MRSVGDRLRFFFLLFFSFLFFFFIFLFFVINLSISTIQFFLSKHAVGKGTKKKRPPPRASNNRPLDRCVTKLAYTEAVPRNHISQHGRRLGEGIER